MLNFLCLVASLFLLHSPLHSVNPTKKRPAEIKTTFTWLDGYSSEEPVTPETKKVTVIYLPLKPLQDPHHILEKNKLVLPLIFKEHHINQHFTTKEHHKK